LGVAYQEEGAFLCPKGDDFNRDERGDRSAGAMWRRKSVGNPRKMSEKCDYAGDGGQNQPDLDEAETQMLQIVLCQC
jgi:hypothetical protein